MNTEKKFPRVGVGVIVRKDGKILLGKRKGAHGEGSWSFPGGHFEFNEEIAVCAQREVMEEAGITIKIICALTFTNDFFEKEGRHYVTLYVLSDYAGGEVKIMEPDKCEEWRWVNWETLPQPLFIPIQNLLKQKINPFD